MINNLPLYPNKRTLKNVIADYRKVNEGAKSILNIDGAPLADFGKSVFDKMGTAFDVQALQALHDILVGYYKYGVIGFDSDDEFIDRFTNRWLTAVPVKGRALINAWQTSLQRGETFTRETSGNNSEKRTDTSKGNTNTTANGITNALERTVPTLVNESESNAATNTESSKTGNTTGERTENITEKREYNDILVLNDVTQTELTHAFFEEFENLFMGVFD